MKAKHTPGPWLVETDNIDPRHPQHRFIAIGSYKEKNYTFVSGHMGEANANLIAAAPELLEALVGILGPLNVCSDNSNVRDDVCLPIDMTMGDLRKSREIGRASCRESVWQ